MWRRGLTNADNNYIMGSIQYKRKGNTMTTNTIISLAFNAMITLPIILLGIQDARRHPWGK
jgi:hypothetical protein